MESANFKSRAIALLVSIAIAFSPFTANAMSMEQMFNSMGNSTPAGAYHGQTQNVYTGGSMSMRLPQKNYQLMSFAPPSFSASCGGIDIFAGSFSFLNSQQLVNVLQNIGSAALSQAFFMAIDAMSPMVGVNLKQLMDKLQKATNQSINSCETGQKLAEMMVGDSTARLKKWSAEHAIDWSVKSNSVSDMAQAQQEVPKDKVKVAEGAKQAIVNRDGMGGNLVWNALAQLNTNPADPLVTDFEARLIMSLVGTVIVTHSTVNSQPVKVEVIPPLPQVLTLDNIIGINGTDTLTGFDIYTCVDGTTNGAATAAVSGMPDPQRNNQPDSYQCVTMGKAPVQSTGGANYKSMLSMVTTRMNSIRDAIRNNSPVTQADKDFVNAVNIPVYKMLSVSAAFRNSGLADSLIEENAKVVAAEYANSYILHLTEVLSQALSKLASQPGFDKAEESKVITNRANDLRMALAVQLQKAYAGQQEKTNLANKIIVMERQLLSSIPTSLTNTMSMRRMGY